MPFSSGRGSSRWSVSSPTQEEEQYSVDKLNKQITNATRRIQDAGYETEGTDKRNWFEKLTNLPQGQNFFFDTLELLDRPGQAVRSAIKARQEGRTGKDLLSAAQGGFTGNIKTSGSDLFENSSIKNKYLRGALGFGTEVLTDPLNLVPAGLIAKGVKTGAGLGGKAIVKGLEAAKKASPGFARLTGRIGDTVKPIAQKAKKGLGYAFVPGFEETKTLTGGESDFLKNLKRETENSRQFMKENYMTELADTTKAAGGIEKGVEVGRGMERNLRQFVDVPMYEFPDGIRRTTSKRELKNAVIDEKQRIRNIGEDIRDTRKQYGQAISTFAKGIDDTDRQIRNLFSATERNVAKQLDATKRADLREASQLFHQTEKQLESLPMAEKSLLRAYKKQIRDAHNESFDILKRIRQVSPNGIKPVSGFEIPGKLAKMVTTTGKSIDEIASELGYEYADDLIQEVRKLDQLPRKLDPAVVEDQALQEMRRSGALDDLKARETDLLSARDTAKTLIGQIEKEIPDLEGKTFAAIADNPEWQALDAQRKALKQQHGDLLQESRAGRDEGLAQIRAANEQVEALKGAMKRPVMTQREVPRVERELSQDAAVKDAAEKLMASNKELRDFAESKGVSIAELEGYMTHILTQEEKARRAAGKPIKIDAGSFGPGQPNKKILESRKLLGSVEDINELAGREIFNPNAFFATGVGQQRLIDYIHAVDLRRQVLSNPDFAKKYKKGMEIGDNVVIDTNNYKFLKNADEALEGAGLADEIGGEYLVTPQVKMTLDRYHKLNTDEGTKAMMKVLDGMTGVWKKLALFSPGFHVRNMAGGMWNNYVGGMSALQIGKYTTEGAQEVMQALRGKESDLFREFRSQGLGSTGLSKVEYGSLAEPEKGIQRTIENRSKDLKGKIKQRANPLNLFETSREGGDIVDQTNRFAIYKWAREKKGMSAEDAANRVRETQFDYTNLTPFEQKVRRVLPFYSWMRNNIPFQVKKFVEDPRKFQKLNRIRENAQQQVGLDDENMPAYMKESFAIPITGEGGKGRILGLNLPLGDITKLSSPLKLVTDAISPLAKTPVEIATNYNMFRRKPIEKFEGQQQQYDVPLLGRVGVPVKLGYAISQLGGQIGKGVTDYLQPAGSEDQDNKYRMPSLGLDMTKPFDAEANAYFEKLAELKKLQDYISYIEQQTGERPKTIRELNKLAK